MVTYPNELAHLALPQRLIVNHSRELTDQLDAYAQ